MKFRSKLRVPHRHHRVAQPVHRPCFETLERRVFLSASLVKDINTRTNETASAAAQIVDVNGTAFFTVDGQIWRSDGTSGGTVQVSPPGLLSGAANLTSSNGALYFSASSGAGVELWRTDGTPAGTRLVNDVNPGAAASNPRSLTAGSGFLYFVANAAASGAEVWRTDGTTGGTTMVADVRPGADGSDPRSLQAVNDILYFVADDGARGYEVWRTGGSGGSGATLVRDLYVGPGTSGPASLTNVNGTLFFSANPGFGGYELWRSDGTAGGTQRVKDINPGAGGSSPSLFTNVNGTLYFSAYEPSTGDELWKSDGTEAGTVQVRDITAGTAGSGLDLMTAAGPRLFFRMNTPSTGTELWTSDGTAAGTTLVRDARPGSPGFVPRELTAVGPTLYYFGNDGSRGYEVWRSDGTPSGTALVSDLVLGSGSSYPSALSAIGQSLYFSASPGDGTLPTLFRSNGTAGGTVQVSTFNRGTYDLGSNPSSPVTFNGSVYFSANDGVRGPELWRSDGTEAGTVLFKDLVPGAGGSSPSQFVKAGGLLYFTASGQVWRSDGTPSGTLPVPGSPYVPGALTVWNSGVVFLANDGATGEEIWQASPSGSAVRLTDVYPGPSSSRIDAVTPFGNTLYFVANDGATGDELWKTSVGASGATRVRDLVPGAGSGGPWFLTAVGNTLFFRATEGTNGWELWRTDGTESGTTMVRDILPGPGNSNIGSITNLNGTAFFTATDGVHGYELWKSDGTVAGTVMVSDIYSGSHGSSPSSLTAFNNALYFRADGGAAGQELWRTDGTAAGTVMAADISPGATSSGPYALNLIPESGLMSFLANDGDWYKLYVSDGTAAGTRVALPQAPWSWVFPYGVAFMNGTMFFGATLDGRGAELWKIPVVGPAALTAATVSPANISFGPSPAFAAAALQKGESGRAVDRLDSAAGEIFGGVAVAPTDLQAAGPAPHALSPSTQLPGLMDTMDLYGNAPGRAGYGFKPAAMTYFYSFWSGQYPFTDRSAPDEAAVRALARDYASYPAIIPDVEEFPMDVRYSSDGRVQVYMERLIQAVDWMHDERPGTKVGYWGILPLDDYFTPVTGTAPQKAAWQAANARLRPLGEKVDVLFPSMYTFYEDRAGFRTYAQATLREAAQYGKPIAPFIWSQYHNASSDIALSWIPADYWRTILAETSAGVNPVTLWGGLGNWDDDAAWWAVTRDFAATTVGPTLPQPSAPAVVQAAAKVGAPQRVVFSFNKDVGASLAPSDLSVLPTGGGPAFVPTGVSYDSATQTATFSFPDQLPNGTYEARLSGAGVTDAAGVLMAADARHVFTVNLPPVRVTVNDGIAQRSGIRSLTVTFAAPVTLQAGALMLTGRTGAGAAVLTISNPSADGRTYVVTFSGSQVTGGSLADGVYDVTIAASKVLGSGGGPFMATDYNFAFHRLYGDHDGDGDMDAADLFQLRSTVNKRRVDAGYKWWFDYDDSGTVDAADLFQIRSRTSKIFKGY